MFRLCPLSGFCTLKLRAIAEYERAENEHYADDDCRTVAVVARNFDVEHAENHTADGGAYERQRDGEYAEPEQAFAPEAVNSVPSASPCFGYATAKHSTTPSSAKLMTSAERRATDAV